MIIRTVTLLLLLTVPGIAQEQSLQDRVRAGNNEETLQTPGNRTGPEQAPWPPPFNPSQEIGADSQVSFPTDI